MKRTIPRYAAGPLVTAASLPTALIAEPFPEEPEVQVRYPTSVTRSEDGTEIHKVYDLFPEQNPAGIPRPDFGQDGFHYILTDLLQRELLKYKSRQHTETIPLESKNKDTELVLAPLPQGKEFVTGDGLSNTLSLQLDAVQVAATGYGSFTREMSATHFYPNLVSQDAANIPESIEEDGRTLTLQNIDWRMDNTVSAGGYAMGDRCAAVATYAGIAITGYVTGYTVTADYTGTVDRIALNRARYVATFEGGPLKPAMPMEEPGDGLTQSSQATTLLPLGAVFAVSGVIGAYLLLKRHREFKEKDTE